jgi:hypothetical protein
LGFRDRKAKKDGTKDQEGNLRILRLFYEYEGTSYTLVANLDKINKMFPELGQYLSRLVICNSPGRFLRATQIHDSRIVMDTIDQSHFTPFLEGETEHSKVLEKLVINPLTNCLVCELPLWDATMIGHMDLLEMNYRGFKYFIWDYKGQDVRNLPSYTQVYLYKILFCNTFKIPLSEVGTGYFDSQHEVIVRFVPSPP